MLFFNTSPSRISILGRKYLIFVSCLWMIQFSKESTYSIFKQGACRGVKCSRILASDVVWVTRSIIYWSGGIFVQTRASVWVLGGMITLQGVGMGYNVSFEIKFQVYILYS